jgi:hypothetical protein
VVRPYPNRGNSGLKCRSIHRAGTNRAYSGDVGGIVVSSFPHAYDGRWCSDLTPVTLGLSGWTDTRTWVTSPRVSSALMGDRRQRLVSGEAETDNAVLGARMGR